MKTECPICSGRGVVIESGIDGAEYARLCECGVQKKILKRIQASGVPKKYAACGLDSFDPNFEKYGEPDPLRSRALFLAQKFVDEYPSGTGGQGFLITGPKGTGKTHLACSILLDLIRYRGIDGKFFEYRSLLTKIRNSYDPNVSATEMSLLDPVSNCDVLVLDELGAERPSGWVWDTVAQIVNHRYNERLTTIITTNFPNLPSPTEDSEDDEETPRKRVSRDQRAAEEATRNRTLGDRIRNAMHSRLQEMCIELPLNSTDFRGSVMKARFGRLDAT